MLEILILIVNFHLVWFHNRVWFLLLYAFLPSFRSRSEQMINLILMIVLWKVISTQMIQLKPGVLELSHFLV